jgi:hypothetical protein
MASLGKKILSAFVEVEQTHTDPPTHADESAQVAVPAQAAPAAADARFADYFDKLFSEANIPGPDYYEFSRMIDAMRLIPDESSRYIAAYAGLQAQGLNKDKLLDTAAEYLRVITTDADHFQKTLNAALQEKVHSKTAEAEDKAQRIRALSQEILQLQEQIRALQEEVGANEEKLTGNGSAYTAESKRRQQQIQRDIEKINQYIH